MRLWNYDERSAKSKRSTTTCPRGEVYRGYRSVPFAVTGVIAFLGGLAQPWFVTDSPTSFVRYWVVVAFGAISIVGVTMLKQYLATRGSLHRRASRRAVLQFLPCLAAGGLVTLFLAGPASSSANPEDQLVLTYLPGIWALLFSLGIFSSRPYLPRAAGWVGSFYLIGAALLLYAAPHGTSLQPWGMASVFGVGQVLSACVLYWNLERSEQDTLATLRQSGGNVEATNVEAVRK